MGRRLAERDASSPTASIFVSLRSALVEVRLGGQHPVCT